MAISNLYYYILTETVSFNDPHLLRHCRTAALDSVNTSLIFNALSHSVVSVCEFHSRRKISLFLSVVQWNGTSESYKKKIITYISVLVKIITSELQITLHNASN